MTKQLYYLWLFFLTFNVYALNTCNTGFRINNGNNSSVNCHGICRAITNSSGSDHFVSTNSSVEWNSFLNNLPQGLSAANCAFSITLSSNENNVNIRTKVNALGYDGTYPAQVTVTINTGVLIGSSSTANPALDTGTFFTGSTISIINNGVISGRGGNGGNGGICFQDSAGGSGGNGGPGLRVQHATTITNNNTIQGGGGGGSGGNGDNPAQCGSGGGGGAGVPPGSGGIRAVGAGSQNGFTGGTHSGGAGGNNSNGAIGGAGGPRGNSGANGTCAAGACGGGGGGGAGANGGRGGNWNSISVSGGSGGAAVLSGNSLITWAVTGFRHGALNN